MAAFVALFTILVLELLRQEWVSDIEKDYSLLSFGGVLFIIMAAIVYGIYRFGRKLQRISTAPLPIDDQQK